MRGWAKKMIWYFGFSMIQMIHGYLYFLKNGKPMIVNSYDIIIVVIFLIPLFYLNDDPEVSKPNKTIERRTSKSMHDK